MLTEQFKAVQEAEATWKSDEMDLPKLHAYEDAERAYRTEVSKWRQWWNNIPDNEEKGSAETNAEDTEDTDVDELHWLQTAVRTYAMNTGEHEWHTPTAN